MKRRIWSSAVACLALAACAPQPLPPAATPKQAPSAKPAEAAAKPAAQNPFFAESELPYHLPPFDKIEDAHYAPAFTAGIAAQQQEIDAIANDSAAPTFDNTVVALERSGAVLTRVSKVFFNLNAANGNAALRKVESEMAPKLAAHRDAILLDAKLFARVDAVYQQREKLGLDPESRQLLDRYEKMFLRAGARLGDADKAALKQINQQLSTLTTRFRQTVLKATQDGAVVLDDAKALAGLPPEQISAAAEAAKARGLKGKWVLTLQNTTIQPPLTLLQDRALRERVFKASTARGVGGADDTTAIVSQIVALRAKKAALLGYPTFAAFALAEETAETPAAVRKILTQLAPAALARAKSEARDIQQRIAAEARAARKPRIKLEPWDWAYYAEQARKASFDFSDAEVKPYFEIGRVLQDGVFYAAHELFGITFAERKDLPVYHPDVRVFEVHEGDGSPIALLLVDYYARDNKQGGAWMDTLVDQSQLMGDKPVVINNLNVSKPAAGKPTLLTFDEVTTMFHEFGHALHGLLSATKYPLLSGIAVPPDFAEFPSQFYEMWVRERGVLANFAKHHESGAPMPKALLDKVLRAQTYGQGYATLEYLEAALLDQAWHELAADKVPAPDKVMAFEARALAKAGVSYGPVPPRYHSTYFMHAFTGEYAAAYYAYIWAEVLARDAGAWFHAHGGLTRNNGDVYRAKILSRGRAAEPSVLFRDFYGREPEIKPLLEYRGLKLPKRGKTS